MNQSGLTISDILQAHSDTVTNGGFTVATDGSQVPRSGYMVGGVVPTVKVPLSDFSARDILDFILTYPHDGGLYVGGWVDDGVVHLDVCSWHPHLLGAITVGNAREELAVYDLAAEKSIPLTETPSGH